MLNFNVRWMDEIARRMTLGNRYSRDRFSEAELVNALLLAHRVRDRQYMDDVLVESIALALPGFLGNPREMLARRRVVPSKAALIGHTISLDAALMLVHQAEAMDACPRYGWADSSPQCGRDWFISKHVLVRPGKVVAAARAANALVLLRPGMPAGTLADLDAARAAAGGALDRNALLQTVGSCIQLRVHPPMALGSGRSAAEHKASALLQALLLDVGSRVDRLVVVLGDFVSFCSDMGPEMRIPQLQVSDLRVLIPEWLLRSNITEDVDEGDVGAEPLPVLALMPFTLNVPGALHICHNLSRDMEKRLGYWRALSTQLNKHRQPIVEEARSRALPSRASWGRSSATTWTSSTRGQRPSTRSVGRTSWSSCSTCEMFGISFATHGTARSSRGSTRVAASKASTQTFSPGLRWLCQ